VLGIMVPRGRPITLALIDYYDDVLVGVARMFDSYEERIQLVGLDRDSVIPDPVDIVLYDSFAQPHVERSDVAALVANRRIRRVVVYSWDFHKSLVDAAFTSGASGYLSKTLRASQLVDALEAVHRGERVISPAPGRNRLSVGLNWPGRTEGLSEREAEILALVTQGKSNGEIAQLLFLSPNSTKTYIRSAYRKIGATNRVGAVLWGVDHGFKPHHERIDRWIPPR
jgi:DNA-binding NarL/FixJ family response regulator